MILNQLLYFISGFMKCKLIKGDDGQPYLERYMVARWGKNGEKTIFLHRFLDSDSDRGIHDHPWDSKSFILLGGYNEKRMVRNDHGDQVIVRDVLPLTFNTIGKDDFHQIILKPRTPAWTLFYHGKRIKHWGFQHYSQNDNNTVTKTDFLPYEDKTNPTQKWEEEAQRGRQMPREKANYIFVK